MIRWSVLVLSCCSAVAFSANLPAPQQTVDYALIPSDIPKPLPIGWANRLVAQYFPSATTADGLPLPKKSYHGKKALSLNEAILLALRNNPEVLNAQMTRVTDKFRLELAKYNYSPHITSGITANTSVATGEAVSYSTAIAPTVALDMPWGTNVRLTYSPEIGLLKSGGDNSGSLTITQPLLQGFNKNKRTLLDARDTEISAKMSFKDSILTVVNGVVSNYLSLVQAQMNAEINKNALDQAKQTYLFAQLNLKAGKTSPSDFRQSKASYIGSEITSSTQQDTLRNQYEKFAELIGLDLHSKLILPKQINYKSLPMRYPSLKQAIVTMLRDNTSYRKALLNMYSSQRGLVDSRQSLWPTLTLNLAHGFGVSTSGAGGGSAGGSSIPTHYVPPVGSPLGAPLASSGLNPLDNNSASLYFYMPIDNYSTKVGLIESRIGYEQSKLTLRKTKQDLIFSLQQDYQTAHHDQIQLGLSKSSVEIGVQVVKDSQLKYKFGKNTAFELSALRDGLLQTRLSYVQAQVQYFKDVSQIHTDIGDGLDVWHIKLRY